MPEDETSVTRAWSAFATPLPSPLPLSCGNGLEVGGRESKRQKSCQQLHRNDQSCLTTICRALQQPLPPLMSQAQFTFCTFPDTPEHVSLLLQTHDCLPVPSGPSPFFSMSSRLAPVLLLLPPWVPYHCRTASRPPTFPAFFFAVSLLRTHFYEVHKHEDVHVGVKCVSE